MENIPTELGDLAKEISIQNVEGAAWSLLATCSKIWKERDKVKKELLDKKKSDLSGVENSQPLQVANDARIKKWLLSKN